MDSSFLDSLGLPQDKRARVEARLNTIRQNNGRSVRLHVLNGHELLLLKDDLGKGNWMQWMIADAASGYHSFKTMERDMALAEAMYDHLERFDDRALAMHTNLTALRTLAGDENAEALEAALDLIGQGVKVKPVQAAQLAEICAVEPRLKAAVVGGEMTIADAHAVAKKIEQSQPSEAVVDLVIAERVRAPELVDQLTVLEQTAPERFAEVRASGAIYNPVADADIRLREASPGDGLVVIASEDAEREARRIEILRTYRQGKPERIADVHGTRDEVLAALAEMIPLEGQYRVLAYPETVDDHAPESRPV